MKTRRLLSVIALLFILVLSTACTRPAAIVESYEFDGEEALKHVVELVNFEGRLPGTEGNILAAEYIAELFAEYGLEARGGDNTYFQWFEQPSYAYPQPFTVEILDPGGSLEKTYRYRHDFIEANATEGYSISLTADAARCTVSTSDTTILITDPNGDTAAMVRGRTPASGLGDNRAAMFIRTGRLQPEDYPTINVTPEVFESITTYLSKGYHLRLSGEVDYPEVTAPNVVALLPSTGEPKASLMVTGHFDHFGVDCTGDINYGAADNASGVAVMLELARSLSQEQLPIDIFFVAFNGEERGLLGAKHYQMKVRIPPGTKMINIDTVGLKEFE